MFLKHNVLTILWAILILFLTLTPGNAMPATGFRIPNFDKIAHFIVFGVFAFLLYRGMTKQTAFRKLQNNALLVSFFIASCFGVIIEFIQTVVPQRSFDLLDIIANVSGITLGLALYYLKDK